MVPYTEEQFDKILRQLVNKIFLKIPYDQLFPPADIKTPPPIDAVASA